MKFILIGMLALFGQAFAQSDISQTLLKEWNTFRSLVETLSPDGDIGGYMDYKEYGETLLLWRVSQEPSSNEVIRFYRTRPNGQSFAVTYHKSHIIAPGRVVLRRFIGPEPTGWINHTIDFLSGEYLGEQGFRPSLSRSEQEFLEDWDIAEL